ncbi:MAG: hypothetical protein K6E12_04840 [Saccharofermentans sp.]|nr:hypothetical protein [Saccharofermentans sp.]
MNDIILPMKVHAVKLEYRRQLLEKMPHGYFKVLKGKQFIMLTRDPDNPQYTKSHPRPIVTTSRLGRKFSYEISEFLKIKAEYDDLYNTWKSRYSVSPPRINFPIIQFSDPHCMNNEYFRNQPDCTGQYKPENPTVSDHGELKSKNEQFGADLLKRLGIPFKYETSIYLAEIEETINPDYLVNFYEIDRCAYLEILGMSDKIKYSFNTTNKLYGFSKEKYRPGREIIYIILYDKQNFDEDYFVSEVLSAYNNMIPDSALIWDINEKVS